MKHPLQKMMEDRRNGIKAGIPSYCTANPLVLEMALRRAKKLGRPVLIEATANQVNQYGGYTGMVPKDFYKMVLEMAEKIGVPENQMILAGRICRRKRLWRNPLSWYMSMPGQASPRFTLTPA